MFRGQRLLQWILPREKWYKCVLPMVSESIHINMEQHKYLISNILTNLASLIAKAGNQCLFTKLTR